MLNIYRQVSLRTLAVVAIVAITLVSVDRPAYAITSDEHLERAQGYFEKRELNASIIELKNALQRNSKNAEARLLLGRVYIEIGRGADAEKELERAQELDHQAKDLPVLLGQAQVLQGNFDAALESLIVVESDPPAHKAALNALRGQALLGLGNTDDAKQSFATALSNDPGNADAHAGLGRIAMQERSFDESEAELAKAIAADPTARNVLTLKGDLHLARGALPEAERAFEKLVAAYPFIPHQLRLAYARSALGKNDAAISDIELVLKVAPRHPSANYLRALFAYRTKDFNAAKFHIDQALSLVPLNSQFQLLAGATNFALGLNEQALRYLERYIVREPSNDQARRMLGATQLRLNNAKAARETLKPFEGEISTDDAQLLALVGTALVRTGDLERGRRYLKRLVDAQPDNSLARAQLGSVEIALGEADQGIEDLEKALERDPDLNQALISLIVVNLKNKQFEKALEAAIRLRKIRPGNAGSHILVGMSYGGLGEIEAAAEAFNEALKIHPGKPDAAINLAALRIAKGDLEEAAALFKQILQYNENHLGALLKFADLEKRRDKPAEELAYLEQAVKHHRDSALARIMLGRAYIGRGFPQKALIATAPVLDQNPKNAAALEVVGEAQFRVGDNEETLDTFRRLVEARPDHAGPHFRLARAYEGQEDFDNADIELQKALLLDPGHTPAKFARIRLLVKRGDLELAEPLLEDLRLAYPEEPVVLGIAARIALRQNRPKAAIQLLEQALRNSVDGRLAILLARARSQAAGSRSAGIDSLRDWIRNHPNDFVARKFLALSYLLNDQLKEARSEYREIVGQFPYNAVDLNNLALTELRLGNTDGAHVQARRALELSPESAAIMDTLGSILLQTGAYLEALELIRTAHEKLSNNTEIQFHLAQALAATGKPLEARSLLNDILDSDQSFNEKNKARELLQELTK